jgi:hypothetical protein
MAESEEFMSCRIGGRSTVVSFLAQRAQTCQMKMEMGKRITIADFAPSAGQPLKMFSSDLIRLPGNHSHFPQMSTFNRSHSVRNAMRQGNTRPAKRQREQKDSVLLQSDHRHMETNSNSNSNSNADGITDSRSISLPNLDLAFNFNRQREESESSECECPTGPDGERARPDFQIDVRKARPIADRPTGPPQRV